jgi:uncharacterized protein (DUF2147 family)
VSSPHSALLSPPVSGEPDIQAPEMRVEDFCQINFEAQISSLRSSVQLTFRAGCAVLLLLVIHGRPALSEVPAGTWLLANRVAVQVFECSGLLCGKIVWLVRPRTPAGQPDVDHLNPDPALRQRPLCDLTIIGGLQPDGPGHWSNGWLYDPQDGTTYDLTAELTAPDRISVRVYRGDPLFGRTEILIRDPELTSDGRC